MDRKDWNRIGLAAAVLLVPGGFLLGATLLARRAGKAAGDAAMVGAETDKVAEPADPADEREAGRGD